MSNPERNNKNVVGKLFPYIVVLFIAVVIEVAVFNFRAFESLFFQERNLTDYYVQTDYGTMLDNGDIRIEGDAFVVSIVLEGEDVHNVYVDAEYVDEAGNGTGVCDVQLYVQDELLSAGEQMVRPQIQRKIFRQIPASEYMFYTPFGKTQMLQLDFYPEAGRVIRLHDMRVNVKRPLFISGGRLLLLFLLGVVLVMFRPASELWTIKAAELGKRGKLVCLAFFAVFILGFAYWILQNSLYFKQTFQPYAELARTFLRGECSVGDATEAVAALEDKLVSWGRETDGIKFDYVLYHGKYYVYFGVLPCLLFYLPWRMITGQDLSDAPVQLLLAGMLVMGLFFLLKEFIRRYYKDASLAILLLFTGMMAYGTYLPSMLSDPNVYQVAILTGVCLTVWGIYCWN